MLFPILTIFLSAFLLFQIQPLISRYILPWFGGTPAVWSASVLFFQTLLLAGYGYAHRLSTGTKRRNLYHLFLLAGSVIFLLAIAIVWRTPPLLPGPVWKPAGPNDPLLRIFIVLGVSVGLPYFILSSTSPLLQSWFSLLIPGRSPYRLYAWSNLGSFLALITYPLVFEPLLSLRDQSKIWFSAYVIFATLCGALAVKVYLAEPFETDIPSAHSDNTPQPSRSQTLLWLALSACTSILLLSITNQLTQEVAVIPFLWVRSFFRSRFILSSCFWPRSSATESCTA
jgi:hypothetical protein